MSGCSFEARVVEAVRVGRWTDELRDHVADCLECAETALVIDALHGDARALAEQAPPLPDPKIIWIRSRLAERRRRARLSDRAAVWVQRLVVIVVCGVGIGYSSDVGQLFSAAKNLVAVPNSFAIPLPIAGPAVVVVITGIVAMLMAAWTERSSGRGSLSK